MAGEAEIDISPTSSSRTDDGELVISYQGRSENLTLLSESGITNTLLRLSRQGERWIVFLGGHGESDPHGEANFDLGLFGKELERGGFRLQQVSLAEMVIPSNTNLLVMSTGNRAAWTIRRTRGPM